MTLTIEQWKERLDEVNLSKGDILEQIKVKLQDQFKAVYDEWKHKSFDVNHLFNISLTTHERWQGTLLHIAAFNGQLDTVKYLAEDKKANLDQKGDYGKTALHWAAFNGQLDIVKYLVEDKKVSLDQKDNYGGTALRWAIRNNQLGIVKYLAEDKKVVNFDQKDDHGITVLQWAQVCALNNKNSDIIAYLQNYKVSLDQKDYDGRTAFDNSSPISDQQESLENNGASDILDGKASVQNGMLHNIPKAVNNKTLEKKNTSFNKSIMIGSVCGVIAALAVGIGCGIAGVELSILAIAVAAALVIGVIAGGITCSVLKPSDKLDKPDLEVANQQIPEKGC